MKTAIDFKKYLPYFSGVVIFFITVLIYFGPLWQGKQVSQHDVKTFLGMSKEVVDFREDTGEEALWTNSMFGGMPAYQISVAKNENLIRYVDSYLIRLNLPRPADYVFLYMLGFFILLLVLGVDPWLSIVGAIAFAFSSYFFIILEAGHNSKAHAIGYMAPTLAFVIYTFKNRKYLIGGILFALFMALELYSNHPQITYYLMFIVLAYGIGELWGAIKEKQIPHFAKSVGALTVGLILAMLVNMGNYWTTYEYSPYTIRGASELTFDKNIKSAGLDKDYATQWSYGIEETLTLMIPNAKGGGTIRLKDYAPDKLKSVDPQFRPNVEQMGSYWGNQPMTSGPVYAGAIVIFLFILSLFIVKGRLKWALLAVTVVSIMLSWGHNLMWFTDLFFDYFPVYNKFRTVSMILVITQLTTALLAFLALNEIIKRPAIIKENRIGFYVSFGLTAGLSFLFYLMPGMFFTFLSKMDQSQLVDLQMQYPQQADLYKTLFSELSKVRMEIFQADSLRSFLFILFAAGIVLAYSLKTFNKNILIIAIGLLIMVDMASVDKRFLNDDSYERVTKTKVPYPATQANLQIMQDKELDYRVYNTTVSTFNDASTSYYHKSIGGYHGAKLRRYQDLIEHHLAVGNMEVVNMLNTKYFIVGDQKSPPSAQMNPDRLGNAWFVKNINWVDNADQEIIHLGRVIELKAIGDISNVSIFGNALQATDTMLITSSLDISTIDGENVKLNFGRLNILPGMTYILGNDANNMDSNFINIGGITGGNLMASKQFEARVIFDFKAQNTAVIDKQFKAEVEAQKFNYLPSARINLTEYLPNHLTYATHADSDQLAVFSEIYYDKGWNVYIDGVKGNYFRADYVLRSMIVPAGDHKIEFKFEPQSYYYGKRITFVASLLLLLLVIGGVVFEVRMGLKAKVLRQ